MLDWLTNLGQKPDHPMHSIVEAERLLSDLPKEPLKALLEVTSWLTTVTGASGFPLAIRMSVVKLIDQAGQPFEPLLSRQYLTARTLKEFERLRLWEAMQEFWERVANAYMRCLDEMQRRPSMMRAHRNDLPLLIVRTLRALANQTKVLRLGPPASREKLWPPLFELYQQSEIFKCDTQSIVAYAGDTVNTSARQELLRALLPSISSMVSMLPYHVELADRIAVRFGSSFSFSTSPDKGCNWCIDLAEPSQPRHLSGDKPPTPTMRFFGAGVAIVKMEGAIRYLLADASVNSEFFGDDFSPQEKLIVFKYLARHWSEPPPRRREPRDIAEGHIAVAHGFKAGADLLPHIEVPSMAVLTRDMEVKLKRDSGPGLAAHPMDIPTEKWLQHDVSVIGFSAKIPSSAKSWARIGVLCALKSDDAQQWWIGVVRRLFGGELNDEFAGIELLAKEAASGWLRTVDVRTLLADNWATSSGSFVYDYMNVILLVVAKAPRQHELLAERDTFVVGAIYEAMVGDNPHYLRFDELLERGEDFDRVRFTWLAPESLKQEAARTNLPLPVRRTPR